jgi:hypothetical protein
VPSRQLGQFHGAHRLAEDGSIDHPARVEADSHACVVELVPEPLPVLRAVDGSFPRARRGGQPRMIAIEPNPGLELVG